MDRLYGNPDLAFIHDDGFGHFAQAAAELLIEQLRARSLRGGTVVDLGCGSGILAARLVQAGWNVVGVDQSRPMLSLARNRAASADFVCRSIYAYELPRCQAVASIGEVVNYVCDDRPTTADVAQLIHRVYDSLQPGGLFLFDAATPARAAGQTIGYFTGDQWDVVVQYAKELSVGRLTRQITTYRRQGDLYRRERETHTLQLHEPSDLQAALQSAGFAWQQLAGYEHLQFPEGLVGYLAARS